MDGREFLEGKWQEVFRGGLKGISLRQNLKGGF
jgi:hypothetical protein